MQAFTVLTQNVKHLPRKFLLKSNHQLIESYLKYHELTKLAELRKLLLQSFSYTV